MISNCLGRIDAIELLLEYDTEKQIYSALNSDPNDFTVNSPAFHALVNDNRQCASW